jgi:hypothetical protein
LGFLGPLADLLHEDVDLEDFLDMHMKICNGEVYQHLLDDVVEHMRAHHANIYFIFMWCGKPLMHCSDFLKKKAEFEFLF